MSLRRILVASAIALIALLGFALSAAAAGLTVPAVGSVTGVATQAAGLPTTSPTSTTPSTTTSGLGTMVGRAVTPAASLAPAAGSLASQTVSGATSTVRQTVGTVASTPLPGGVVPVSPTSTVGRVLGTTAPVVGSAVSTVTRTTGTALSTATGIVDSATTGIAPAVGGAVTQTVETLTAAVALPPWQSSADAARLEMPTPLPPTSGAAPVPASRSTSPQPEAQAPRNAGGHRASAIPTGRPAATFRPAPAIDPTRPVFPVGVDPALSAGSSVRGAEAPTPLSPPGAPDSAAGTSTLGLSRSGPSAPFALLLTALAFALMLWGALRRTALLIPLGVLQSIPTPPG